MGYMMRYRLISTADQEVMRRFEEVVCPMTKANTFRRKGNLDFATNRLNMGLFCAREVVLQNLRQAQLAQRLRSGELWARKLNGMNRRIKCSRCSDSNPIKVQQIKKSGAELCVACLLVDVVAMYTSIP